jgi:hypothetical protein
MRIQKAIRVWFESRESRTRRRRGVWTVLRAIAIAGSCILLGLATPRLLMSVLFPRKHCHVATGHWKMEDWGSQVH